MTSRSQRGRSEQRRGVRNAGDLFPSMSAWLASGRGRVSAPILYHTRTSINWLSFLRGSGRPGCTQSPTLPAGAEPLSFARRT
jgi:hypothetical protein